MTEFSHIDPSGNPSMVDVGKKNDTERFARARARVYLPADIMRLLANGEIHAPKGAVFQTAIIAGILAAKKTGELIPLCHPLGLHNCQIQVQPYGPDTVDVVCSVSTFGKTGVEMEALTGASVAALTIYDMCKALSHEIVVREIRLLEKTGGKHDFRYADPNS